MRGLLDLRPRSCRRRPRRRLDARNVARPGSRRAPRGIRHSLRGDGRAPTADDLSSRPRPPRPCVRRSNPSPCATGDAGDRRRPGGRRDGGVHELRVSHGSTLGFTDDTGTVAAHRRLGLARAVKLESLRRLRHDHPRSRSSAPRMPRRTRRCATSTNGVGFRPSWSRRWRRCPCPSRSQLRFCLRATQPDRPSRGPGLVRPARRPLRVPLDSLQCPQAPDRCGAPRAGLTRPDHGLVPLVRARRRAGDRGDRPAAVRGRRRPRRAAVPDTSAGSAGSSTRRTRTRSSARRTRRSAAS